MTFKSLFAATTAIFVLVSLSHTSRSQNLTPEFFGQMPDAQYFDQFSFPRQNFMEALRGNQSYLEKLFHESDKLIYRKSPELQHIPKEYNILLNPKFSSLLNRNFEYTTCQPICVNVAGKLVCFITCGYAR